MMGKFWRDNPYKMLGELGFKFYKGGFGVGLHFDTFPSDFDPKTKPSIEFWITVERKSTL